MLLQVRQVQLALQHRGLQPELERPWGQEQGRPRGRGQMQEVGQQGLQQEVGQQARH